MVPVRVRLREPRPEYDVDEGVGRQVCMGCNVGDCVAEALTTHGSSTG